MTAGLVGEVNEILAVSESIAPIPSSRYCGLKAICRSSPSKAASRISVAWASSDAPASSTSCPGLKARRTGVLRSATSATRLTASANELAGSSAVALNSLGSRDWYLGYSPLSSLVVVCRPVPAAVRGGRVVAAPRRDRHLTDGGGQCVTAHRSG